MTDPKTRLSELIHQFEFQSDFSSAYLDRRSGEILRISDDDRAAIEHENDEWPVPDWQKEHLAKIRPILEGPEEPGRYLHLPEKFDFDEYRAMERFISGLPDERVRGQFWSAINGKGAFRRFKERVGRYGLAEQWYQYRDDALKRLIIDWCEAEDIPFIDDTT